MPTFILATKLAPLALQDADARKKMGKRWLEKVNKTCPDVKWIAHYAILGAHDFIDIYEASGPETASKVALISRSEGAVSAETWVAMPYEQFLKVLEQVD
jgi:uncharacterized protein with GYD domain